MVHLERVCLVLAKREQVWMAVAKREEQVRLVVANTA
jgi:hypothetical protein